MKPKTNAPLALANHPMFSESDLAYLRRKGYSDNEILSIWDRDHADGKDPVEHAPIPDYLGLFGTRDGSKPEMNVALDDSHNPR